MRKSSETDFLPSVFLRKEAVSRCWGLVPEFGSFPEFGSRTHRFLSCRSWSTRDLVSSSRASNWPWELTSPGCSSDQTLVSTKQSSLLTTLVSPMASQGAEGVPQASSVPHSQSPASVLNDSQNSLCQLRVRNKQIVNQNH